MDAETTNGASKILLPLICFVELHNFKFRAARAFKIFDGSVKPKKQSPWVLSFLQHRNRKPRSHTGLLDKKVLPSPLGRRRRFRFSKSRLDSLTSLQKRTGKSEAADNFHSLAPKPSAESSALFDLTRRRGNCECADRAAADSRQQRWAVAACFPVGIPTIGQSRAQGGVYRSNKQRRLPPTRFRVLSGIFDYITPECRHFPPKHTRPRLRRVARSPAKSFRDLTTDDPQRKRERPKGHSIVQISFPFRPDI